MNMHQRKANAVCVVCGKDIYIKLHNAKVRFTCSKECGLERRHYQGTIVSWRVLERELGVDFKQLINFMHNTEMKTIKEIAEIFGMHRSTITRMCSKNNIITRSISEDNYRRYATMTEAQIKEQTAAANVKMRELMKDEEYKAMHVNRVLSAQNFNESSIERIVKDELKQRGVKFKEQHQIASWFIDITFPEHKLAIEIDGDYWHSLPHQIEKDRNKDNWLTAHNWKVLRIKERDINKNVCACVDRIMSAISPIIKF